MRLKLFELIEKSFKAKLIFSFVLLILIIFSFYLFFSLSHSIKILEQGLVKKGIVLVEDLGYSSEFGILAADPTFVEASILGIFEKKDVLFVVVYDRKGKVIAAQKRVDINLEVPAGIIQEISSQETAFWKERYINKEKFYEFYAPIIGRMGLGVSGEVLGFSRLGLSLADVTKEKRAIFFLYLLTTIGVLCFGGGVVFYLTQKSAQPINELMKGVKAVKEGNFSYRIQVRTKDEFGILAQAFNRMTEDLERSRTALEEAKTVLELKVKARTKELKELAESLEEKVKERTKELQDRVKELEKFHKLTVGRELKMVELKKEIEKLKKKGRKSK